MADTERTKGQQLLEAWLAEPGRSRRALGKKLGNLTGQAVSAWLSEKKPSVPDESLWPALEAITGIKGIWFLSAARKEERAKRRRALARVVAAA